MRENYKCNITEVSKELSAKERVAIKDTTNCVRLDEATTTGDVNIDVDFYAVLRIHNDASENKDYNVYVLCDKNGTRYTTGSDSLFDAFKSIYDEMKDSDEEWGVAATRRPSKSRSGKDFLTCYII